MTCLLHIDIANMWCKMSPICSHRNNDYSGGAVKNKAISIPYKAAKPKCPCSTAHSLWFFI